MSTPTSGVISRRLVCVALLLAGCGGKSGSSGQETYATPEEAFGAIADVAGTGDMDRATKIFGTEGLDLLRSGDDADDRRDALRVKALIQEKLAFESDDDDWRVGLLGNEGWPFAIPLEKVDGRWRFDVDAGREELDNRRVGRNELAALETLHAYVEAQREYREAPRDGKAVAYAQKVRSTPGSHDGLFWETSDGQPESPLGPLMAAAEAEGRVAAPEGTEPAPFHGYHFRILTAQGDKAPGGAYSYVDGSGLMTRGFAAIAWPARYGSSGVMTFLVSPRGVTYQKDLGDDTDKIARGMTSFDPDTTWTTAAAD